MSTRKRARSNHSDFNIPEKASRVLNIILLVLVLIAVRLWHLSVIQYDAKVEESQRPQKRMVVEPARRATIRDRFNMPLAINKGHYQAAILYSQFKTVPSIAWTKDASGKRVKQYKRKEYISSLATLLAQELDLDAERLEDLIHSKASMYYNLPFIIKEDLTEQEYYRLKMLEKDWVGLQVQRLPKRTYPMGRVASDILGFMGAINRQEYENIVHELKALDTYIKAVEVGDEPTAPPGVSDILQARQRYRELKERAYTVNDYVGKMGIEGRFEEDLRGFRGKKFYYSDARGNLLRELPGSTDPLPGNRFLLTISAELQEYAEHLLIQNDRIRETKLSHIEQGKPHSTKQPWIKGGAIVAMDPHSGEILAMASHPRYDPNDFVVSSNPEIQAQKRARVMRWFESEEYIAQIWDQKRPLERELFDDEKEAPFDDSVMMTWDRFLEFVLPPAGVVSEGLVKIYDLKNAIDFQNTVRRLLQLSNQDNIHYLFNVIFPGDEQVPYLTKMPGTIRVEIEKSLGQHVWEVSKLKNKLLKYLGNMSQHYDKVLLVDLCRLAVCGDLFSEELVQSVGKQSLTSYRNSSAAMASLEPSVKSLCKNLYHDLEFKEWRRQNEQAFIKKKRTEEVAAGKYAKPYIDYLDALENQMYNAFWSKYKWYLVATFLLGETTHPDLNRYTEQLILWYEEIHKGAHQAVSWKTSYELLQDSLTSMPTHLAIEYLQTFRSFHELNRPLLGKYRHFRKNNGKSLEKHLAASFYPTYGFGYGRSYAYRQAATQGSLFKLVTAYAALAQRYHELDEDFPSQAKLNPLTIHDEVRHNGKELCLGYHADGTSLPQFYKGGRLIKSSIRNIGKIDLVHALAVSSNPYFSLLAGDYLHDPLDLIETAKEFSFGSKTGVDLCAELSGRLPDDVDRNKTGLYSLAIGQHTLVVTPLQTSVMLSAIANGGKVVRPKIVGLTVNTENVEEQGQILCPPTFPLQEDLALVGIDFPLFTAIPLKEYKNQVNRFPNGVHRELFMPSVIREMLLEGMQKSLVKMYQNSLGSLSKFYRDYPEAISDYVELKDQLVGKTSTAESMENIDLDILQGTNLYTHVWFGGISFDPDDKETFIFRDALGRPELVVVVYLRYGHFGKEAAPVAAQVVNKWREIKAKHRENGA